MTGEVTGNDVFISCKNLDENGGQTRDAEIAAQIYDFLTGKGLNVFLSTFTLEQLGAADYSREIDSALEAATVLVAIGTSADHLNSEWVRYEWDSFANDIRSRRKPNGRIFTYIEGIPITASPRGLRQTQTFVHGKDPLERLYNFINKALRPLAEQREHEEKERLAAERRKVEEKERLEAERRRKEESDRLETEQREKERLAEERQRDEQERVAAEKREREEQKLLAAEKRQRDEWEAEQRQREEGRLEAELRQREEQNRLEHERQSQLSNPIAPTTSPAQPKADKASAETPKVVHPLSPKSSEPKREKPTLSKRIVAFLAAAAALVVAVLIYLATTAPLWLQRAQIAESLAQAQRYLDAKDFAKALSLLQKAADAGNADAMFNLGWTYENRWAIDQDLGKAREWYQKAADAGNANAMYYLGVLYEDGKGVTQDYGKAREWYQKAVDAGNREAMFKLGLLYEDGKGVTQDYGKAREWYQKAVDAGNREAMFKLGLLYEDGKGVTQDYGKAREWYQKAADAGSPDAMYYLGVLYEDGKGGARDQRQGARVVSKGCRRWQLDGEGNA